jgi:hypothetical protein
VSDGHDHGHSHGRPSFGALVTNWREYDAPFLTKLRLAARNTWITLRTRRDCCGNHGEPGC